MILILDEFMTTCLLVDSDDVDNNSSKILEVLRYLPPGHKHQSLCYGYYESR